MNIFKVNGKFNIGDLIISLIIHIGGASVISLLIYKDTNLYSNLAKPIFAPPMLVFPIVWGVLYLMMSISSYRIYELKKQGRNVKNALVFYSIQLLSNFLWPIIFFKFRLYGIAFIELVILALFLLIAFIKFIKLDKIAGYLLILYNIWIVFAGVLNFFIWMMNEM